GSADNVVFPVPESPKNNATSPSFPTFAEQCIDKTLRNGKMYFITEKIDFLISPAYSVPPIKTTRSLNEITINVSDAVPSSSGSARQVGADNTVNSGSCSCSSSSVGVINNC